MIQTWLVKDENGKAYTVRYEAVNAVLLNEFLKKHRKVEKLEAMLLEKEKAVAALTAAMKASRRQRAGSRQRNPLNTR